MNTNTSKTSSLRIFIICFHIIMWIVIFAGIFYDGLSLGLMIAIGMIILEIVFLRIQPIIENRINKPTVSPYVAKLFAIIEIFLKTNTYLMMYMVIPTLNAMFISGQIFNIFVYHLPQNNENKTTSIFIAIISSLVITYLLSVLFLKLIEKIDGILTVRVLAGNLTELLLQVTIIWGLITSLGSDQHIFLNSNVTSMLFLIAFFSFKFALKTTKK